MRFLPLVFFSGTQPSAAEEPTGQAEHEQMQRIIQIKEPLHRTVEPRRLSPPAVIQAQQRDRQHDAQLQKSVYTIQRQKIHQRIERHIKQAPSDLLSGVSPVCADGKDAEGRDAAPVRWEGDDADQQDARHLHRRGKPFAVIDPQHEKAAQQRPDHTGLIQE